MVVHSLMPELAGFALRTTGDPRRGRCKKGIGADIAASGATSRFPRERLGIAISAGPAPGRFAPPAAPFSVIRSLRESVPSLGHASFIGTSHARPRSALAPGRYSVVFLSVPVERSTTVTSRYASAPAGHVLSSGV